MSAKKGLADAMHQNCVVLLCASLGTGPEALGELALLAGTSLDSLC